MATAIRGAIIQAKMSVVPIRRGYWGNKIGKVRFWRCDGGCEQALLTWLVIIYQSVKACKRNISKWESSQLQCLSRLAFLTRQLCCCATLLVCLPAEEVDCTLVCWTALDSLVCKTVSLERQDDLLSWVAPGGVLVVAEGFQPGDVY